MRRTFLIATTIAVAALTVKPFAAQANPAIPVVACASNPACVATIVTIGGIAYWEIRQGLNIQHIPLVPMIQNPDGRLEDESITIYADSKDKALNQCHQTAKNRSDRSTIVSCLGCRLMTTPKTGRYACTLRIETVRWR